MNCIGLIYEPYRSNRTVTVRFSNGYATAMLSLCPCNSRIDKKTASKNGVLLLRLATAVYTCVNGVGSSS